MDVTEVLADLAAKRAYLAEWLRDEPLPIRDEATVAICKEIEALGLERHSLALETDGYTVL